MEARLKAKELVDKMLIGFIDWTYHVPTELNDNHTILSEAKQRAIIAVDEVQQLIKDLSSCKNRFIYIVEEMNYWQEVKQEINLL